MHSIYYTILAGSTFFFASLAIYAAYLLLNRYQWLDAPNERSNHKTVIPTGAGIAFILIILGFLMVANTPENILWGALLLTVISFLDDRHSMPIVRRMAAQVIAVVLGLGQIDGSILQGHFPVWFDYMTAGILWLWFINLYNFMDGIDEITVTETSGICAGIIILGMIIPEVPRSIAIDAVIVVAGVLAFYPWNKSPAKLFMGDAGSVPLGFLIGYLLLRLAASGHWEAALILPAYYISDATITLMRRALAGKAIWKAHSEHFYQIAVRNGASHQTVSRWVMTLNLFMIALACISVAGGPVGILSLAIAYWACCVVLWHISRPVRASSTNVYAA